MTDKFSPKNGKDNEKKIVRKEDAAEKLLHQPRVQQAMDWIMLNLQKIGIAVGATFLLFLIIMSMVAYKSAVNQKALALEGKAFTLHQEAQEKARSARQNTEKKENAQPEDPYKEVIAAYQDVISSYGDTESGKRALYMLGSIQLETGKYDDAKKMFDRYLAESPNGILAMNAEEGLAYILEQQQKFQEALAAFKALENKVSAGRQTEIQLAIARNDEALKDIESAKMIYKNIMNSNTAVALKNKAKDRLEILDAQEKVALGPVAPTPPQTTPTADATVTPAAQASETPTAEATKAEQSATPVEEAATPTAAPTQETPAAQATVTPTAETTQAATPTTAPTQETPTAEATSAPEATPMPNVTATPAQGN